VLIHSKGIAYVEISSLPDAVRADLGLPTTADVARQETEERRQIEEKKRFEAAQRAKGLVEYYDEWITPAEKEKREKEAEESRKEALRASIKTIKEVETDQSAFLDKRLVIGGRIDVDNYYNWKYGDAQDTHYSFRVSDGTGLAHLYADRVFGKILRDDILKAGSALRGSFSIRIESERYDEDSGEIMARIVSWGPPAD
jgi:hypothetical protein